MRSDEQRVDMVRHVLARGGRVLLSHDIHTKHRTRTYGGETLEQLQKRGEKSVYGRAIS